MAWSADDPVLALRGVTLTARRTATETGILNLELGRGTATVVEIGDSSDADLLVDLCLGLLPPVRGDIVFLGESWRLHAYRASLALRGRIGLLVGGQAWPADVSVAEAVLIPRLYHTDRRHHDAIAAATRMARRFGLPGLPVGPCDTVPAGQLTRAACVRAFTGAPDLVLISDDTLEGTAELGIAMAQSIAEVQNRGGAVLWIVESMSAPVARFVRADQAFRFDDRGFVAARRTP